MNDGRQFTGSSGREPAPTTAPAPLAPTTSSGPGDPPSAIVRDLIKGTVRFSALYAFVRVAGPQALADGPLTSEEVAERCQCDPVLTRRMLRALEAYRIVTGAPGSRYRLSPAGRLLLPDVSGSLRAGVLLNGSAPWREAAAGLSETLLGRPPLTSPDDSPYERLQQDPELAAAFDRYMTALATPVGEALAARGFEGVGTVVDLGGGRGTTLAAILRHHPQVRGVLVERPSVAEDAARHLAGQGLDGRCEIIAGDMFTAACPPAQRVILSAVLHNWGDDDCAAILRQARSALTAGGPDARLWCVEELLPPPHADTDRGAFDLDMRMAALFPQGRERTADEYRDLLGRAGLRLETVHRIPASPRSLMIVRTADTR
ncbi:methyltransferase [Actinomadura oligospora]|uniref:methyltransferase n=1 Tax=Actinomadura oligospora TaxID=111804 RepID=UPI0004B9BC2A|nr:methyltransferase [Actinomadura oligospora]